MYYHRVQRHGSLTSLHHLRTNTLKSGLATIEDLGHTVAIQGKVATPANEAAKELGLTIASAPQIQTVDESRTDNNGISDDFVELMQQEPHPDLDAFIRAGIEEWKKLIPNLGEVIGIEVHAVEVHSVYIPHTESGLVIVSKDGPEEKFVSYLATPDEMEAMEHIANSVPLQSTADSKNGSYL